RAGNTTEAEILVIGNFTAAYRIDDEVGFLSYSPAGRKLFALSTLPSGKQQKQLLQYMDGLHEAVPMDISRGAALSQLTNNLSLRQQIGKGGPLVWPILAILVVGILIVIERVFFLYRRSTDADALAKRVEEQVMQQNRQEAVEECAQLSNKPVARVMAAGLAFAGMQREIMENGLQEAILREIPPLERCLSTLAMLAAIAPLLGLLGTVTGMIDTFYVITQHGTGDPRMMSGGISVALVTTMLGLSVAIPIMLAHTLINRTVDNRIAEMEEKAVALVNIVHKQSYAGN
ncbi:MAG: MotA/TolQ/ExbB proton channel family protein, partial [Desulforhopalus sp.]